MLINKTKYKSYWTNSLHTRIIKGRIFGLIYSRFKDNDYLEILYIDKFILMDEYQVVLQTYKRFKDDIFNLSQIKNYKIKSFDEIVNKFDLNNKKIIINNINDIYGY
jgi:hypothetical protein